MTGEQKMKSYQTLQAEKFSRQSQQAALKMKSNIFSQPTKVRTGSNSRYENKTIVRPRDSIGDTLKYKGAQNVKVVTTEMQKQMSYQQQKQAFK